MKRARTPGLGPRSGLGLGPRWTTSAIPWPSKNSTPWPRRPHLDLGPSRTSIFRPTEDLAYLGQGGLHVPTPHACSTFLLHRSYSTFPVPPFLLHCPTLTGPTRTLIDSTVGEGTLVSLSILFSRDLFLVCLCRTWCGAWLPAHYPPLPMSNCWPIDNFFFFLRQ